MNLLLSNVLKNPQFCDWFCGVTDGDGSFSFSINKRKTTIWNCTFKIGQSNANLKMLYFIKSNLGCGEINLKSGKNMSEFRIRKRDILINVIIPIFKNHFLFSTKIFYFLRFSKALEILENSSLTSKEKHKALENLKKTIPPLNYLSPNWQNHNPSNDWIYGFTEAEGSFFLTLKKKSAAGEQRIVHSFELTQKLNKEILEFIKKKLKIKSKVQKSKKGFYKLETSNYRALLKIKEFYLNKLKGIKSLEYKIWARSLNYKSNFPKLLKIQAQLRKLRRFEFKATTFL